MRTLFIALAFFATMSILPASGQDAAQSLVDAEKSFAQTSLDRGIRESFLKFFADDCVMFAPGPTNGKKVFEKFKDEDRKLFWQPAFAAIAKSGDFGITTGPWEMRRSEKPIGFGQFVSVWKKQSDGNWKVIFDTGVDNPQPKQSPGDADILRPADREVHVDLARSAFDRADESLRNTMKESVGSALIVVAAEQIRVLRDDVSPAIGKPAARLMLNADQSKMTRTNEGGEMSASGDLAYKYGSYSAERGNVTEHGHFLTIWRAQGDEDWKVIVDLRKKEPPK
jgi:ketosteroid isomerase-like protein